MKEYIYIYIFIYIYECTLIILYSPEWKRIDITAEKGLHINYIWYWYINIFCNWLNIASWISKYSIDIIPHCVNFYHTQFYPSALFHLKYICDMH